MGFMRRLPRVLRRFKVRPAGVIHVGAHEGQEAPLYDQFGFGRQVWIEPQPEIFARLKAALPQRPTVRAINIACGEAPGQATMHVLENNKGLSNSLLEPTGHLEEYPKFTRGGTFTVPVARLDDALQAEGLSPGDYSTLSLDVQGYELHVLKGAPRTLAAMDAVISEVNTRELYKGCVLLPELDAHLAAAGFVRVLTNLTKHYYGDALYVRPGVLTGWQKARLKWLGPGRR
jgi:FkbM family methyltransferase